MPDGCGDECLMDAVRGGVAILFGCLVMLLQYRAGQLCVDPTGGSAR